MRRVGAGCGVVKNILKKREINLRVRNSHIIFAMYLINVTLWKYDIIISQRIQLGSKRI